MLLSFSNGIVIRFGRTQNDAMTSPIAPRSMPLYKFVKHYEIQLSSILYLCPFLFNSLVNNLNSVSFYTAW